MSNHHAPTGRRRAGHVAMAGILLGMVGGLTLPSLDVVQATSTPPDSQPVDSETAPADGGGSVNTDVSPTTVETTAPATTMAATVAPTTTVAATTAPATTVVAPPDSLVATPGQAAPSTSEADHSVLDATVETTTTTTIVTPTSVGAPTSSIVTEPADTPALEDPTYGVTVAAVCVDLIPVVDVTSTGTGDIRVAVGPASMVLTQAQPTWRAPWPTLDDGTPDTSAKWDAVRVDTQELVANGVLTLPPDCPPPPVVPSAPEGLSATAGNTVVSLQWSAPASDGGSPIQDYLVEQSADGITGWTAVDDGVGTATTATVTGLTNGTVYYFRILAVNANGTGPASVDVKVTPRTVPGAPQSLVAAPTNVSGQVRLTWVAPSSDGGSAITDYVIERSLTGTSGWTVVNDGVDTVASFTVTGLTNGIRYYFRVSALNAAGTGVPSAVVNAIPRTLPTAPRSLLAAPTNRSGEVRLTWTTPLSDGGSAVTDYVIQRSPNGSTGWVTLSDGVNTATAYTAIGLVNGTRYYFRVYARNVVGQSPASNTANAIPRTVPTAPRSLTAAPTGASGQLRLTWVAPLSNGGSAITDYVIQRSPNGSTGWVTLSDGVSTATAYTAIGLVNGTRYYFRVYARNVVGQSPASNTANGIPVYVLTAPRSLTATPGNASVRLTWTAPLSNGGSAITDYLIQRSPNGTTWTTLSDGVNTATAYTVTGLTNGARYYFRVYARTAKATSPSSNVVNTIPRTVPSAPRSPVATPTNLSGQIRLTWVAPASNGGSAITDYVIQRSSNGTTWTTISDGTSTATAYIVTGLANGARYYFRVFARNAAGYSAASATVNAIPRTVPSAPRSPVATPTNLSGQIRLTWVAPLSNGGSAITDYVIQRSTNGTTWTTISDGTNTATAYIVTGLANGTRYYFRVFAKNAAGTSAASATVNAIPRTVPGVVGYFEVYADYSGFYLYWGDPVSTGGSPITGFVLLAYDYDTSSWFTFDDAIDPSWRDGFIDSPGYGCGAFRIAARNAAGVGPYSAPVEACNFADAAHVDAAHVEGPTKRVADAGVLSAV